MAEINKVVALCIRDKKLLIVRNKGEMMFFSLGGRIESGETELECLHREVKEEVGCSIKQPVHFKIFEGMNHDGTKTIRLSCYLAELEGNITPQSEIEEYAWIDKDYLQKGIQVAPTLEKQIIPELIKKMLL